MKVDHFFSPWQYCHKAVVNKGTSNEMILFAMLEGTCLFSFKCTTHAHNMNEICDYEGVSGNI